MVIIIITLAHLWCYLSARLYVVPFFVLGLVTLEETKLVQLHSLGVPQSTSPKGKHILSFGLHLGDKS